ncbi:Endonuclease 4 [Planctomycetes bacterium MalM25]|nr:Endonuclease 4 [Planctomycetes bacterium MalM25]
MAILGAHMSIAGGYHKAVRAAHAAGCGCVQIFTKNNNQWAGKPLTDADCEAFKSSLVELGITHPVSHNSYLINLASPKDELWEKSIAAMVIELERAEALGVPGVVAHPGSFTTSSEEEGLTRIARGLDEVHAQTEGVTTQILLETTAGQGSNLGWRFEQIGSILEQTSDSDRLGVCFDTCHVFAAGYPMATADEYADTMEQLDKAIGCERVKAFHLNDSLKPFGSRKDRHAGIGRGEMGVEPFRHLLNDPRFERVPMYLETPKGEEDGEDLDVLNLGTLRSLIA